MNFQLIKLIIWPKKGTFPPQIITFQCGKVNVITGDSRTGKTAIIPIIDYCLASSDCMVPIDTIRDHASWYGIVFQTETEQVLMCRKVPEESKASNDFYFQRGELISVPNSIEMSNETLDGIKNILNTISSVPYFPLAGKDSNTKYGARLSFRDLMALIFQTQDIVANQNILFYKTHTHAHRERLRNWFPFILGAETIEILKARQRLAIIEKRLNQAWKELEGVKAASDSWIGNIWGHIEIAKEYGLLENDISKDAPPEVLIETAKQIVDQAPEHSHSKSKDIEASNQKIAELEKEEELLSFEIALVKKQLKDVEKLSSSFHDYKDSIQQRTERLHISKWLEDIAIKEESCPVCGSTSHKNTDNELKKIASVFQKYENDTKRIAEVPTSFLREEELLKSELDELLLQLKKLQERFDLIMSKDKNAQAEFQRKKNMFIFIGHLKASLETYERFDDGGEFQKAIDDIEEEQKKLNRITDPAGVKRRTDNATMMISQGMLNHLKTLDVEPKYRSTPPGFNVKELNISVLSDDGHWHFLSKVGSGSNWVSFHIALMCALQEYLANQSMPSVPNFVVFDQPSQVYFPKVKRGEEEKETKKYEDQDIAAVKMIFETISNSISAKKGAWQCIILDHADSSIYGEIDGICEIQEWRNGNKLIPEEWYSSTNR